MAINPLRIPNLTQGQPIVDEQRRAMPEFFRRLNDIFDAIRQSINAVIEAQNAAAAAQLAAENAQASAEAAQQAGEGSAYEQALKESGVNPTSVITATPTTITIEPHTRVYGDGISVPVDGDSIAVGGAPGDTQYVFYLDPTRAGGAVTYQVALTPQIQGNDKHVVGAVVIPTSGTNDGGEGPRFPGQVFPTQ